MTHIKQISGTTRFHEKTSYTARYHSNDDVFVPLRFIAGRGVLPNGLRCLLEIQPSAYHLPIQGPTLVEIACELDMPL